MQSKIILADEYPVVLLGAEDALLREGWTVALTTSRPFSLDSLLSVIPCDVLVADFFQGPGTTADGFLLLDKLIRQHPRMGIIAFTEMCKPDVLRSLLHRSICGLVDKGAGLGDLVAAVGAAQSGRCFISDSLSCMLESRKAPPSPVVGQLYAH